MAGTMAVTPPAPALRQRYARARGWPIRSMARLRALAEIRAREGLADCRRS